MLDVLIVILIVAAAAWYVVRRFATARKDGGCGCGGCGGCPSAGNPTTGCKRPTGPTPPAR